MSYLELQKITYAYGPEDPPVFRDFSMSVDRGAFVSIEGDNGSGKTTLFRILNGLSFPEEGTYTFDGIRIDKAYLHKNANAKRFHKRIGYLFQDPDVMLFNARVYDEVAFGPRQMGFPDEEADRITKDCLKLCGIEDLAGRAPYHLSGGQKSRVALASVLALDPEVLILDEPYANLDGKTREMLTSFLSAFHETGKTVLIATHETGDITDLITQSVHLG